MIALDGCRSEPLGSYLQGLGAWRAVCRLTDPEARAHWQAGRLVLTSTLDETKLVVALRDGFSPLPLVSPWNGGSGFAGNGKSAEAERALAVVRQSSDRRLADLREAVQAADRVVARGLALGWGGTGDELWDKKHKAEIVRLCRNLLPDAALPWLDAAVVLGQDASGDESLSYNRLLGTGGNFGRLDLQSAYVQRALAVLVDKRTTRHSEGWLRAALFGDETTPYLRESVGQFDPGRAGGIQSSPREKGDDKGFANPWAFLLTIEGALLFASAAVRRLGARSSGAAVPFVVRASTVGFGSSAPEENALAEIWTPQWERPATLAEVRHLLGEGRAEWNGRPAQSGLDFVRAVATLGVDRGVRRFTRHVVADRLGQIPLAMPVGTVDVRERGGVRLLADVDGWLSRLRGVNRPAAVDAALRRVDDAMYEVGRVGGTENLRAVLVALGRLHETVSRSGTVSGRVPPLTLRAGAAWWRALSGVAEADVPGSVELRLAAALASGRDGDGRWPPLGVRRLVTPVAPHPKGYLAWTGRPAPVPTGAGVAAALVDVHRRRARPGAIEDPVAAGPDLPAPAVKGTFSAFRSGLRVALADTVELATGRVDLDLLQDDLVGLLLLDWSTVEERTPTRRAARILPPALAMLLPFYADGALQVRLHEEDLQPSSLVLRPDPSWPTQLAAGAVRSVLEDAAARLRAAGLPGVATPLASDLDGALLAGALLLRVPERARATALQQVAALPTKYPSSPEPEPEGVPA